jgi:N-acetylmuramoyl-L-alanine amidase
MASTHRKDFSRLTYVRKLCRWTARREHVKALDCIAAVAAQQPGSKAPRGNGMAQIGRLAVFAMLALMSAPIQWGLASEANAPIAVAARLSQDENEATLVFDLSRSVEATASVLASPDRIVVETPQVNFQLDPSVGRVSALPNGFIVKSFRFGLLAPGRSRIVIDLARSACPAPVFAKPIVEGEPAARLTIELKPCDPSAFAMLARSSAVATASGGLAASPAQPIIVLDPGHGGVDGGARGLSGIQEKTLVLSFCAELKRQLDATKRYAIVMTRNGDQYVDLDDRVVMARKANASLFISVHADTLSEDKTVSGSTVYTVADHASDAEAARIAARENAAGRAPGPSGRLENPDVADILFDLKRRETRTYAHIFSRGLVDNLRGAGKLNHNPERSAGFVVLKAPEFPSVLVELGYLSNPQDVEALTSQEWRRKAAAAMVKTIDAFFAGAGKPDSSPAESGVASSAAPTSAPSAH